MNNKYFLQTILFTLLILINVLHSENNPIAVIIKTKGKVYVFKGEKELKADKYMPLYISDKIKTLNSSYAEILFDCGITLRIEENSFFEIKNLITKDRKTGKKSVSTLLNINSGSILIDAEVNKDKYELNSLHIITPTTVASVRGTVFYVKVSDDNTTDVAVFNGKVECILGSYEQDFDTLFEEELEQETRKKIIIEENKQTTISSDLSSIAVVDLSFNLLEYKKTVVKNFLDESENNRKSFKKFEKERDNWIKSHKEEFQKNIKEKREKFLQEFELKEQEFKKKRR